MLKVKNKKVIFNIAQRHLKRCKARNVIAIIAIALTTLMFTSLFTIMSIMLHSFEQETFRMAGGDFHGTFKRVSWNQIEKLEEDSLITNWGARLFLGSPEDIPFNKCHVEVSYMDEICAKGSFCMPTSGTLPKEGTHEIVCDTNILNLLGIKELQIGQKIQLSYYLNQGEQKTLVEDQFTLSGWWEYDAGYACSMALVSRSYAEEIIQTYLACNPNTQKGFWDMNIYLKNDHQITEDLITILKNHGYQCENEQENNYLKMGVNWCYLSTQMGEKIDLVTSMLIGLILVIIILTGYLIIHNIFVISVNNDIRFYGMLKTIGMTGSQLRRIINYEAFILSIIGIPIGLGIGYLLGKVLTPTIIKMTQCKQIYIKINPWIFVGSTLFALVTIWISCNGSRRIVGKVSPVEAACYTENAPVNGKVVRHKQSGGKPYKMAWTYVSRRKGKMIKVILSLILAALLLEITSIFSCGFDMDKYISHRGASDFIVGNASYFQSDARGEESTLDKQDIEVINGQDGIAKAGAVYMEYSGAEEYITDERFRQLHHWLSQEQLDGLLDKTERNQEGRVRFDVQLYGMEAYPLSELKVLEGDLQEVYDPEKKAVAAISFGEENRYTNWAKVGEEVKIRYVDNWHYIDEKTGKEISKEQYEAREDNDYYIEEPNAFHEETYKVAAIVEIPSGISYRYFMSDQFILNAEVLKRDCQHTGVMNYLIDMEDGKNQEMESFLKQYTESVNPALDYESKQAYAEEFYQLCDMFIMVGGMLSFIVGLVGVLNFFNTIFTMIMTRRREFAMLQSIGMTGRQLKQMLMWEGMIYALFAAILSLVLSILLAPLMGAGLERLLWFFTYHFNIAAILVVGFIFIGIGCALPTAIYHFTQRETIVERLRHIE